MTPPTREKLVQFKVESRKPPLDLAITE